jgi:hypothetical protein
VPARRRDRRNRTFRIHLTEREFDALRTHAAGVVDVSDVLDGARRHGPLVSIDMDSRSVDNFLQELEETSNSARTQAAMELLGRAFVRIEEGFGGETDPGAHMLRPAIARLDMSPLHGQYLAFIHAYTRVHRRAPAETDIQEYFGTSAPSVHSVLKTLERKGLISRRAGVGRSIKVLLPPHEIPELE